VSVAFGQEDIELQPHTSRTGQSPDKCPVKWRIQRSRIVHQDRWVCLRADDCEGPGGIDISPYYVLEYPDFVHAIAIDRGGGVLLVRQYRHGMGELSLELPGGVRDASDATVEDAAVRELLEETGYRGTNVRALPPLSVDPARMSNRLHPVLITEADFVQAPEPDGQEEITVVRVPVREAAALALGGSIANAAHVGMLLMGLSAAGLFP
jgi:8-oxo-dGTP pyrophosphatase MutT (NUDIX family)